MYTMVSIMNMYACSTTIRMWNIDQKTPSAVELIMPTKKNAPLRLVAAHSHNSRKMISPAYMLPYNRSECDSGLDTYSTMLNRKLNGHRMGFAPKGAQNSSWIQPPRPFTFMLKKIIRKNTDSDRAKVVLTSAVGTMRNSCWWNTCVRIQAMMSTGRKSMAFISSTHTNTASATGAPKSGLPWKMPFTWSSTKPNSDSTKAWRLFGTPEVAPRTTNHIRAVATTPRITPVANESTCSVQKGPSATGCVRLARWWPIYWVAVSSSGEDIALTDSL